MVVNLFNLCLLVVPFGSSWPKLGQRFKLGSLVESLNFESVKVLNELDFISFIRWGVFNYINCGTNCDLNWNG